HHSWIKTRPGALALPLGSKSSPEASLPFFALKEVRMAGEDTPAGGIVEAMAIRTLFVVLFALLACDKSSASAADLRKVPVVVDGKGFTPSSVDVKKSEKVQLVFTRTTDETCAKEVVFPEINLKKDLPLNKPVAVDVPTESART